MLTACKIRDTNNITNINSYYKMLIPAQTLLNPNCPRILQTGLLSGHNPHNLVVNYSRKPGQNPSFVGEGLSPGAGRLIGKLERALGQRPLTPANPSLNLYLSPTAFEQKHFTTQEIKALTKGTIEGLSPHLRQQWSDFDPSTILTEHKDNRKSSTNQGFNAAEILNKLASKKSLSNDEQFLQRILAIALMKENKQSLDHRTSLQLIQHLNLTNEAIQAFTHQGGAADFIATCLYFDPEHILRLHYYPPNAKDDPTPHSHAKEGHSQILAGRMTEQQFEVTQVGHSTPSSFFEVSYSAGGKTSHLENTGKYASVVPTHRLTFRPGDTYEVPAGTFHQVATPPGQETVTLFSFFKTPGSDNHKPLVIDQSSKVSYPNDRSQSLTDEQIGEHHQMLEQMMKQQLILAEHKMRASNSN